MISKPGMQSGMQRIGFGESKGQSSIHINTSCVFRLDYQTLPDLWGLISHNAVWVASPLLPTLCPSDLAVSSTSGSKRQTET
jgi:hypothetical protein